MRQIVENVFQLEKSEGANGYVVRGENRTAVIDPGMASAFDALLAELQEGEPVTDILLTHYDFDHSQVVKRLQQTLQVPVWISTADAAILRGEAAPPTRFRRFLNRVAPVDYPDGVVEITGTLEVFPGLFAFPTPGHTPGHLGFRWRDVLFTGDAVTVTKEGDMRQFFRPVISDRAMARTTERLLRERIAAEGIEWLCTGHNPPTRWVGGDAEW
ncbi:MBL fold metallo-hydrolase [Mycetocola manganoxydans]|uniref:MBL fold metallo-hydrolase n=1 Tax=Mycetocola manganoxydans TaxID=699879 RepID=A0A3L6ZQS1_9MICO|nr:MBL fold metallo-hydrolase [Mycetocola manganoxydans]RLP70256.1 MBL fold metallo-hydrolase [Mycetocola manganoxydans]GHD49552.1 MBL fold metallo-hydrolase [Mycetocola manganoxydans]